ncbi:hypothetical protein N9B85_00565 [bacterium]|nr:hypothetical protein [bacterium]
MTFSNMSYPVKSLKNTALKERITFVEKKPFTSIDDIKRTNVFTKSKIHLNLNTNAMKYFKSYEENHRSGGSLRFFFLTLTLNETFLYSIPQHERFNHLKETYEHIIWYVNKGLGIKKPSTTKTHKHKVVHSYVVCEDITRNGHNTLEHLHSVIALHPSHSKTIDKDFFNEVISFNGGLSIVKDLVIEELPIHYGTKQKWNDLQCVVDYINKGATLTKESELYSYHSPSTPTENPYENRNTNRPLGTLDSHLTRTRNLDTSGFQL